jgi:hypothetical protein
MLHYVAKLERFKILHLQVRFVKRFSVASRVKINKHDEARNQNRYMVILPVVFCGAEIFRGVGAKARFLGV